jgi:hypothetical protein
MMTTTTAKTGSLMAYQGVEYAVLGSRLVAESGNTVYTVRRKAGKRLYALLADRNGTLFSLVALR